MDLKEPSPLVEAGIEQQVCLGLSRFHEAVCHYYQLIKGINEELILGIEPGTYTCLELRGIKSKVFSPCAYNPSTGNLISGLSCNLNNVENYRDKWQQIQKLTQNELPTPNEIKKAAEVLFNKTYAGTGRGFYEKKITDLESKVEQLSDRCQELELENKQLKRELNLKSRQLSTPSLFRN